MLQPVSPPPRTRAERQLLPVLPVSIAFFDLSLTSTGVALFKNGHIETERWRVKSTGVQRLAELDSMMRSFLMREFPTYAGVEGYSFGSKNSRAHSIGEWGGVAKLAIRARPRTTGFIASPSTVKKFITGDSNAPKSQIPLHLYKRYGIDKGQEDEADAASGSILIGAYIYADAFPALTNFQRAALKGIEPLVDPVA